MQPATLLAHTDSYFVPVQEVGEYLGANKNFTLLPGRRIHWPHSSGPPRDLPFCGFDGSNCRQKGAPAAQPSHTPHTCEFIVRVQSRSRCTAT